MLYDYPKYYEAAFSFRDYRAEVDFIEACAGRYLGRPLGSVLEIGCGPAPHAGELVERGVDYLGMDINPVMLKYARDKWSHLRPKVSLFRGDMVAFEAPRKVDMAMVMLGSLYLGNQEQMVSHFEAVANSLKPGGLYFLDWCVQLNDPLTRTTENEVHQVVDGLRITSRFDIRLLDPIKQTYEEKWTVVVDDHGTTRRLEMIERNRAIFPQEFMLFVSSLTRFELLGLWPDWKFEDRHRVDPREGRPFALLRKR